MSPSNVTSKKQPANPIEGDRVPELEELEESIIY